MAGENFTNTFGGENVSPANLSYKAYTLTKSIQLTWAFEAVSGDNPTADKIDFSGSAPYFVVKMPPANKVTVGQDMLLGNIGGHPVVVADHDGGTLCVVASGLEWFIYLTGNDTPAGTWRAVQFGAGTSTANSAALAGAGLKANGVKLDQNLPTTERTTGYTINTADRATVLQNNGGSVNYVLPDATLAGNGWFVYVVNLGDGDIVLTPLGADTIDEQPNKTLSPGESLILLSDGLNFKTVGYGRFLSSPIKSIVITAAGSGTLVLNELQVASQIQDFVGTVPANKKIDYGSAIGYWFVYNHATNSLKMTAGSSDPGVEVRANHLSVIRSDGAVMRLAYTELYVGTVSHVATTADLTGGPITTTGTLGLSLTGVAAGIYGSPGPPITSPVLSVSATGRILAAGNLVLGSAAGLDTGTGPGDIPVLDAGGNLPSKSGGMQPGDVVYSIALTKPGFVFANGSTIGNVGSGAGRANADTINLFTLIWALPHDNFPIYSPSGVLSTRGINALDDFNDLMRIAVPDLRGTVIAGLDNAGGATSAARLSGTFTSTVMGERGGVGQVTLTAAQLPAHTHPITDPEHTHTLTDPGHKHTFTNPNTINGASNAESNTPSNAATADTSTATTGITLATEVTGITVDANTGGGGAHTNTQPTLVMNPFIKL